jgi:uncharacterized membrane protein YuzA (DUF378 family)
VIELIFILVGLAGLALIYLAVWREGNRDDE